MELSSRDDISLQRFNSEGDILQALINEKVDVSVTDEVVFNAETRKEYDVKVAVLAFAGIKPPSKKHFPPDRLCLNYRTVRTVPFVSWLSGPIMISKSPGSHTHSRAWL